MKYNITDTLVLRAFMCTLITIPSIALENLVVNCFILIYRKT